jgi:hypothetical protein
MTDQNLTSSDNFIGYKSYHELVADYKPLEFKVSGRNHKEHLVRSNRLLQSFSVAVQIIKVVIGLELTYFDLRSSLTPQQRKVGDMRFISHMAQTKNDHASRLERLRYQWLTFRYGPEIIYISKKITDLNDAPITSLSKEVRLYILRWQYSLIVEPKFVELIHGMNARQAKQTILSLSS